MIESEIALPIAVTGISTIDNSSEVRLTNAVGELWHVHNQAKTLLHQSREELKGIRADLSRRLHELKSVLSRPGRGGAWSSFLQGQKIPRSTADRLVRGYEKTTMSGGGNCAIEQTEPTEVVVRRYVRALWPRLSRVLTTSEAVHIFIVELHRTAERSFETKNSVMVQGGD
jgi:hypothetical protein